MNYGCRLNFYKEVVLFYPTGSLWWTTNSSDWLPWFIKADLTVEIAAAVKCLKWGCCFSMPCLLVSMPDASRSFEEQQLETCTLSAMSWLLGHDLLQQRASTSQPQIQGFTGSMVYQTRGGWTRWLATLVLMDCWLVHVYLFFFSSCFFILCRLKMG